MGHFFRDQLSIQVPVPVETLVPLLRQKLVPPDGWGNWLVRPLSHPFEGEVTADGLALWTHYAKLTPRVRGRFVPLPQGTEVQVEITTFRWADGIIYGVLLCFLAVPLVPIIAYGVWLLTLGNGLGLFLIAPPLLLLGVVAGCVLLGAMMALSWTRSRLTDWLSDTGQLGGVLPPARNRAR